MRRMRITAGSKKTGRAGRQKESKNGKDKERVLGMETQRGRTTRAKAK